MDFYSGIDGKATVDGTELPITGWDVAPTAEIVEFRNSMTGSYSNISATFKNMEATVRIDHDFDASVFDAPISLEIGDEITELKLFLRETSGQYWHLPSAIITTTPQSLEVEGKIATSFTVRANGQFGRPGNPVA